MCRDEVEDFLPHIDLRSVHSDDTGAAARPNFPGTGPST